MRKFKYNEFLSRFGTVLALILFLLLINLLTEQSILSISNLKTVGIQATVLIIASLGLSLIMMSGEIDLSFGGTVGLLGALFAMFIEKGMWGFQAALFVIFLSIIFGVINGILTCKCNFSSFLASISVMFIAMGLQRYLTDGLTIWINNPDILDFMDHSFLKIPYPLIMLFIIFIVYYIIIDFNKIGFKLKIVGENKQAAKEVGMNTNLIIFLAFVFGAFLYGIASIIETIRVSGAVIYAGQNILLPAMAACFLGTTMFYPGKVNPLGTIVSAFFLSFIVNLITFLGLPFHFTPLIQGFILLGAVILSNINDQNIKQVKLL